MKQLEEEYVELSEQFVKSIEENKQLKNKLEELKEMNTKLISMNNAHIEHSNSVAKDTLTVLADNEKLTLAQSHGAVFALEDGNTLFLPFLNEDMSELMNFTNRPTKMSLTFSSEMIASWIEKAQNRLLEAKKETI